MIESAAKCNCLVQWSLALAAHCDPARWRSKANLTRRVSDFDVSGEEAAWATGCSRALQWIALHVRITARVRSVAKLQPERGRPYRRHLSALALVMNLCNLSGAEFPHGKFGTRLHTTDLAFSLPCVLAGEVWLFWCSPGKPLRTRTILGLVLIYFPLPGLSRRHL